ncbi:hypothetical protein ACQHIH_21820 (plasmid) [Xanthomonas sontii]|uniref:hypothetical protein n=1 Tax=Xanthomonas sontii TaxID=2650745 RepID=UPI003F87D03E
MHTTIIELEFIELPDTPGSIMGAASEYATTSNGFLLSMWNAACRIATWRADIQRFEDAEGLLNHAAIRAWAPLPRPVDAPSWGQAILEGALTGDEARPGAGWLEPIHAAASAAN